LRQSQTAALPAWLAQPIAAGALAGIAGGVVFGLMMQFMMPPMMGMIGSLFGIPALGWGVHLVFSAIIGAIFGLAVGTRVTNWAAALGFGAAYGLVWWILGPLVVMPTWLGMGPQVTQALSMPNLMSLVGHVVYGVLTGVVYRSIRAM
jgi:hypothetical protein